ncbi:MAG TPA: helix-turn-helix transcriptional regulator [Acidimicrobiales bacterium]|jgi:transcriptional regulator with XRE-family HTH domain|nr:helix-turn-helix transcriptional regulator [Acidimicrobiales bacterium]
MESDHLTIEEWERRLGTQVRTARVAAKLDQATLAELANVSVDALSRLERGRGSSLKTLVSAVRALGRTDWLETLAPTIAISPMQMLRARGGHDPQNRRVRRVRRPRTT